MSLLKYPRPPRCPACGYAMMLIYDNNGLRKYECFRWLSDAKVHNEYRKAHPEEFK